MIKFSIWIPIWNGEDKSIWPHLDARVFEKKVKLRPWPKSNFTVSLNNNVHAMSWMKFLEQRIFKSMVVKSSDVCELWTGRSYSAGALSFMVSASCPESAHLYFLFLKFCRSFKIKEFGKYSNLFSKLASSKLRSLAKTRCYFWIKIRNFRAIFA